MTNPPRTRSVWFRDQLVPVNSASVSALSATAQYGVNVFEGLRAYLDPDEGLVRIFRFGEHLRRLRKSSVLAGMPFEISDSQVLEIVRETVAHNAYVGDISIRLCLMLDAVGSWSEEATPSLLVAPIPAGPQHKSGSGYRACVSSWRRINDDDMPPAVKAGANYMAGRYAMLEARRAGYDLPIFLTRAGRLAEAPGASVLIANEGTLVAPPMTDGILDGITRDSVFALASDAGIPVEVRGVAGTELRTADEVFACGSAVEVRHVSSVNGLTVGEGSCGPVTSEITRLYGDCVRGRLPQYAHWLTPISEMSNS